MTTTTSAQNAAARGPEDFGPLRPLSVNIRPILESGVGLLTDVQINDWFEGFDRANEGRGFLIWKMF